MKLTNGGRASALRLRRGNALVESALFIPIVVGLLIGTAQLGKLAYTYYMLQKTMLSLARYLGTQQGVNFCDDQDASVQAAINYPLQAQTHSPATPLTKGLTPDLLTIPYC